MPRQLYPNNTVTLLDLGEVFQLCWSENDKTLQHRQDFLLERVELARA
ncbi:hypothetical protein [Chroococcidiopsis sp. SAG 2025]|nr:hypothetical protein [Chroococcidiopsis sp. SAG 2025]